MFNLLDVFVVIVTLCLAVYGFHEGLLRGAIRLVGFVAVIIFMALFSGHIVNVALKIRILPQNVSIPLTFFLTLIIGTSVFHIVANVIHKLVHMTPAGFIDSGLGCALGFIKALFLNGLLAIVISLAPPGSLLKNQYEKSLTGEYLVTFLSEAIPMVKKAIIPYYKRFAPVPHEPERKRDDGTISPNLI